MSAREFDRTLAEWLAEGPTQPPVEVVNRALRDARRMGQARTINWPWTDIPSATARRPIAMLTTALAAVLVIVVVTIGIRSLQPPAINPAVPPPVTSPLTSPTGRPAPSDLPEASPLPEPSGSSEVVPSSSPGASATDSSPSAQLPPNWREVGSIGEEKEFHLLGFAEGYLAYALEPASAWFSADGQEWEAVSLPVSGEPCAESEDEGDVYPDRIEAGATDGHVLLLLGVRSVAHPSTSRCALQSIAWVSSDGRTWQRSAPFGDLRRMYFIDAPPPAAAWVTVGRFEAVIGFDAANYDRPDEGVDHRTLMWGSSDGLTWREIEVQLDPDWTRVSAAADSNGRRLVSLTAGCPVACASDYLEQTALVTSTDGLVWEDLGPVSAGREEGGVTRIAPPSTTIPFWTIVHEVVADAAAFSRVVTVRTSLDLRAWETHSPPTPGISSLLTMSHGLLIEGCSEEGADCAAYVSLDAETWARADPTPGRFFSVAEGPAGVLAVAEIGTVYRLGP